MTHVTPVPFLGFAAVIIGILFVNELKRFKKKGYMDTPYRFCILFLAQTVCVLIGICIIAVLKPKQPDRMIAGFLLINLPISAAALADSAKTIDRNFVVYRLMKGAAWFVVGLSVLLFGLFFAVGR